MSYERPWTRCTRGAGGPTRCRRRPRSRRSSPASHRTCGLYRALLSPGGGGPLGHVLHRDLRARSLTERTLAGAPDAALVASAVAATFAGVLADWLHGLLEGTPEEVAHQVWQLLVTLHMSR